MKINHILFLLTLAVFLIAPLLWGQEASKDAAGNPSTTTSTSSTVQPTAPPASSEVSTGTDTVTTNPSTTGADSAVIPANNTPTGETSGTEAPSAEAPAPVVVPAAPKKTSPPKPAAKPVSPEKKVNTAPANAPPKKWSFAQMARLDGKGGMTWFKSTGTQSAGRVSAGAGGGLEILATRIPLKKKYSLDIGGVLDILYLQKGFSLDEDGKELGRVRLDYISFLLMAKAGFAIPLGKRLKISPTFQIGPSMNVFISNDFFYSAYDDKSYKFEGMTPYTFGLEMIIGAELDLGVGSVALEAIGSVGLSKLNKTLISLPLQRINPDADPEPVAIKSSKNSGMVFLLSYKLPFSLFAKK